MYFQRHKYFCFLLLFILASFATAQAHQTETVDLKLNLKKGDRYYQSSVTELTVAMDMMGMAMDINQKITFGFEFSVEDVDKDQVATMSVTYKDIAFTMDMTGVPGAEQTITYDSKKQTKPTDPALQLFAAMVGKSYTMKLAPKGHIEEVQGLKEIISSVLSAAGAGGGMESIIDEESMQQSMEQMFDIYPDKPVRTGDTWTKKTSMSTSFLNLEIASTYTLQERSNGLSTLEVNSTIRGKPGAGFPGAGGMMTGTQKGTLVISEDSGWIKEGNITQNISGNMEMVNPATNETISFPMSMILKTSYTSEKK